MESTENSYCRLCAKLKHNSELLNLQFDEKKIRELVEKLNRVNADTNFFDDLLPKTICFECLNSLNRAFDFVMCIEEAQDVLSKIFLKQIKREIRISIEAVDDKNASLLPDCSKDDDLNVTEKQSLDQYHIETTVQVAAECKTETSSSDDSNDALIISESELTWKDYNWTCSYCETQFPTIDELRTHSMQYHKSCNPYRCWDCNSRKVYLERFLAHVRRHRKYLKKSCYKCFKTFKTSREVNKHASEHKISEHICTGCNFSFTSVDELNKHSDTYQKYQNYKKAYIRSRQARNSQLSPESFACTSCNKVFKYRSTLNRHIVSHTTERDHTCDKCGKTFLSAGNLSTHLKTQHENQDIRPYICEICNAAFKMKKSLRTHVETHDTTKPFACDQCGRCFRILKQLKLHKMIHTNELPYVCSYCEKNFRLKSQLTQHLRQHTGVKPYSCADCQHNFTNWPNYNKHMKRRHGKDMAKKKRTPDGSFPIDQNTGEVIVPVETPELLEWKEQILTQRKPC